MEYNVEDIRAIVKRWLAGETTLAEERALSEYFAGAQYELPADLQPYPPLFGQSARAAGEKPGRKLVLHTEPVHRPLRRWIVASAGIAAAIVTAVAVFVAPERSSLPDDIVCVVNGTRITEPDRIAAYTREALEIANDNLRRPGQTLSSELGREATMARVGEMLNELIIME